MTAKQSPTHDVQPQKRFQARVNSLPNADLHGGQKAPAVDLPNGWLTAGESITGPLQAAWICDSRLADTRIQAAQRRMIAGQIGKTQGNTHLQHVIDLPNRNENTKTRSRDLSLSVDLSSENAGKSAESQEAMLGKEPVGETPKVLATVEPRQEAGCTLLNRFPMLPCEAMPDENAIALRKEPIQEAEGMKSPHTPIKVDNAFLKEVVTWTGSPPIFIGGPFGYAHRGEIWEDHEDHKRLILFYQPGAGVAYLANNECYIQTKIGFASDVGLGAVASKVERKTRTLVRFIEIEMAFLKGVVSGASLPMFLLMTGADITQYIIENRKNFSKWMNGLKVFLKARVILKEYAPTLYDTIFYSVLKEVASRLPDSIEAEDYAGALGGLLGGLLKSTLAGSLTLLKSFLLVFRRIAGKIPRIIARTVKEGVADYRKGAQALVKELRKLGIEISPEKAKQIIKEYIANKDRIDSVLDELVRGLEILNE